MRSSTATSLAFARQLTMRSDSLRPTPAARTQSETENQDVYNWAWYPFSIWLKYLRMSEA